MRRALRIRLVALLAVCLAGVSTTVAVAGVSSPGSTPPPGATALCRDGTYSFSQTRSGSCSHHGGVGQWLDGNAASTPSTPPTTTTQATATGPATTSPAAPTAGTKSGAPPQALVGIGRTVLLATRTRLAGCKLGANPDRRCSPGGYYSQLTQAVICSPSFHTGAVRNVPQSEKFAVEREYGLIPQLYGRTLEIDHIVSLELGGSNDISNLYPEQANAHPGYQVKDRLENKLHQLVCSGAMTLGTVQQRIAANWQALYTQVFGIAP